MLCAPICTIVSCSGIGRYAYTSSQVCFTHCQDAVEHKHPSVYNYTLEIISRPTSHLLTAKSCSSCRARTAYVAYILVRVRMRALTRWLLHTCTDTRVRVPRAGTGYGLYLLRDCVMTNCIITILLQHRRRTGQADLLKILLVRLIFHGRVTVPLQSADTHTRLCSDCISAAAGAWRWTPVHAA